MSRRNGRSNDLPQLPPLGAPRFTQVPNLVLDDYLPHLDNAQLRVLLVVLRETFGWRRDGAEIPTRRLVDRTGLSARSVRRACAELVALGVLRRTPQHDERGQRANRYELVVREDD